MLTSSPVTASCAIRASRSRSLFSALALTLCALLSGSQTAHATQQYAQREGRACQYCHVSGSPGTVDVASGTRQPVGLNTRGVYYGQHNLSFTGYVEPVIRPNAPSALLRFIARDILPDNARRVAVADLMGDGTPRLITLNEKPDSKDTSELTVKRWDGKAFVTEFHADTPGAADKLAVGHFATDGKMVAVTSRAVWYWNGKTYASKSAPQTISLMGSVHTRADNTDRVLVAAIPTDIRAYRISLSGSDLLADGQPAPTSGQVSRMDMHAPIDFFDKMQMPSELTRGGILGLWAAPKINKSLLYHVDLDQEVDIQNPRNKDEKAKLILKSQGWKVGVVDPLAPSLATQFFTPRLLGEVYDVATESAHGDRAPGLLILTSQGENGKGRSLYFFALNSPASTTIPASN